MFLVLNLIKFDNLYSNKRIKTDMRVGPKIFQTCSSLIDYSSLSLKLNKTQN